MLDLSNEQAALFVQMAERYYRAARQGEYEHNLKLLAAFLTSEIKAEAPQPGSFLDMARRLEGLNILGLRAIALISQISPAETDQKKRVYVSAAYLANGEHFTEPFVYSDATDTLSDLTGRGFLYVNGGAGIGKTEEFYHPTQSLRDLLTKAYTLADANCPVDAG